MLTYQDDLPHLPIPSLNDTKAKLLQWIEPLIDEEQFRQTEAEIERFFTGDGEATILQAKLHEWDRDQKGSWLKPFWDDSYLKSRASLPYNMNFNVSLESDHYKERYSLAEIIAKISRLVAEKYHAIIDERVAPSKIKETPLDRSQYKNFFRSTRIPQLGKDVFHVAQFDKKNNDIVLLYKNNIYQVQVTDSEGMIYHYLDIATSLQVLLSEESDEGINVGIFTTAERDIAAKMYNKLRISKVNESTLQTIADALVVISIDEKSVTAEEMIQNLMLNAANKYFDKTIQVVVTKQCEVGFNMEHSAVDGTSVASVISYVRKGLEEREDESKRTFKTPLIQQKKWELTSEIKSMLTQMEVEHKSQQRKYDLQSYVFDDFGSSEIKKMYLSPDAFFQTALQVAMYRTYGRFHSVYEPVSVRFFYEGRTECARATSMEKRRFVEAMVSEEVSDKSLYLLMQKASDAHSTRIKDCQNGLGVERHMYGLEQIYHLYGTELGINQPPGIFQDIGYQTLRHDFISTSGIAYEGVKYRMFGPVVQEGHGVAYIILDDQITMNISSYIEQKEDAGQLFKHIIDALRELKKIVQNAQKG